MSTLTIQPSDIDTFLRLGSPNTNYGTSEELQVWSIADDTRRVLLKFNFSALPANATISAAALSLYLYIVSESPGRTYWAYELTQTAWTETGATWNKYDGTNNWATAGGDYTTTDGASAIVPAVNNWMDWNVLALVQHFQSAHSEVAHFLVKDGTETTTTGSYFYSREYATNLTLRPKLLITYTVPAAYTLSAEAGSYSKTGQAAGLRAARKMAAGSDSYALTGQSVGLKAARKITAGPGSYALTGQDAVLRAIRKIEAGGGSYTLTGQPANLVLGLYHYKLVAEAGYYCEPYSKIFVTLDGRIYKKIGDTYLRLS